MSSGKLSIIIPVYNSAGPLEKCIESVLNQTYTEFNLYLVDDNSTDNRTGKVCDEYALRDKRVHVIHHDRNRGLSISREDGFYADDSEWVSFIDNDDLVAPYMYEEMMRLVQGNGQIDMVCIRGENKTEEEMEKPVWDRGRTEVFSMRGRSACNKIYAGRLGFPLAQPIWGKMIKRELIERARVDVLPYREKLYWVFFEDVLFTPMVYYHACKVIFDNRLMYMHRRVSTNLSSSIQPKEFHYESVEAGMEVLRFFEKNRLREAFEKHIIGCFLNMQSIWYRVWKNERDADKKEWYNKLVDKMFAEYGKKLYAVKNRDAATVVKKVNIAFFRWNRQLWGMTAGNFYFGIISRMTYGNSRKKKR